jgi:hypothetical protein
MHVSTANRRAGGIGRDVARVLAPLLVSGEVFDDPDELVGAVSVLACEVDEVSSALDDRAVFRCAGNRDAAAAAEFEQALVAELAESAEDGVGVDAEEGREVFGGWESFAALGFAVGDGAADLACDLFVQVEGAVVIELDISHGAKHYSSMYGDKHHSSILMGESP